ncbi:metal-dependent hydrolase [Halomicrococcus sp. NG-SE-24]|uniref:metal-dependent hydrolase n=1 Tax=Halomicrococcus sp. NG-SE-24 TaxID=3436928 RepID=UPI003D99776D
MYRPGHYGVALLTYTPIAMLSSTIVTAQTVIVGAVITITVAMLPDIDLRLPFVRHRGITHTVWFAGVVGVLLAIILAVATSWFILAVFLGGVATISVCSHLLADAVTPMGIRPFEPFWSSRYSLGIVLSENLIANYGLFGAGITVSVSVAAITFHWI